MNRINAFELVATTIAQQFGVPIESISEATVALDVDGWDSFSNGILIMTLEERAGRPLPFDELSNATNVGEMAAILAGAG